MKKFYVVSLFLSVGAFAILCYSLGLTWPLAGIGSAMLLTIYYFYRTKLTGAQTRAEALAKEVEELHLQLDSSITREQKAYKESEKAKEVKRQLLATVNHEIRTPMNGMLGMATLLAETPLTGDQQEYIDTIRYCGEKLLVTVNDILVSDMLNFSKSDREGEALDKKDFEIRNCVKEVLLMFVNRVGPGGPDLVYCMDAGVPEQVNGDRKRLSQILMNLVENAVRFTKRGEILIHVRGMEPRPGTKKTDSIGLSFEVKDTGCGIPKHTISQLFKGISTQELAANGEPQPAGLGLVVCKKLVEVMGGAISVESEPGKGSVFTFNLFFAPAVMPKYSPLNPGFSEAGKKIKLTGAAEERSRRNLSEKFAEEFPLRILVAEDNDINQKVTMKVLGKLGYKASLAENGKEVLEMVDLEQYDVILMDVQMPVMDGLEATRMLRMCLKKQPVIIAMTANSMEGDQNACIQAGMDDYISKPLEIDALLVRLEKWGTAIKANRSK